MSTMPRKVSFYQITGGKTNLCFVFLETIARAKPRGERACTLHLSSRTGTTVIWQQKPLIRGMYFMYFLFDCFGVYEPPPWDYHAYSSYLEKQDNNQKLAESDHGCWATYTFFRTLGALTQFTISGWDEKLRALCQSVSWGCSTRYSLFLQLYNHLDDLCFHYEKSKLHIQWGKFLLREDDKASRQGSSAETRFFLEEYVRSSEYGLQCFDRLEKKIRNTIELVRVRVFLFPFPLSSNYVKCWY